MGRDIVEQLGARAEVWGNALDREGKAEIERLRARNQQLQDMFDRVDPEMDKLHAEIERLRALVIDLANELEGEVEARYVDTKHYPGEKRKYERDMDTIWKARRALDGG